MYSGKLNISGRIFALLLVLMVNTNTLARAINNPQYVGAKVCGECHKAEYSQWQGSHHDQAMQRATEKTVLANFTETTFEYNGITSTFFKKGNEFWVNTDGPDGKLTDFKIQYAFGVHPLQQYLIGFDDGRFQALSIAWDSRSQNQGGQRWFHLYPNEKIDHTDILHWTRHYQNWNGRCADCHSTDLQKNYSSQTNSYDTTWSEINVACESCHGAGANHLAWSKNTQQLTQNKGFKHDLAAGVWQRGINHDTATRVSEQKLGGAQVNSCAFCHSLRGTIHTKIADLNGPVLDSILPSLITSPAYHVDGQILGEDYVYGSFTQSKMHQKGVVCSNCHNPHSLELKVKGNGVCTQCHNPDKFEQVSHHHHQKNSGAKCANCHMPETTYMVVDPRRDHSIRIPRPDLSAQLNTPNACNQCHQDKSLDWVKKTFNKWYPAVTHKSHYGQVFLAAQQADPSALPKLATLAGDSSYSLMVRASAVGLLSNYANQLSVNAALTQLESNESLIRLAALRQLDVLNLSQRLQFIWPLLQDPVKAIRLESIRLLAPIKSDNRLVKTLSNEHKKIFSETIKEYLHTANTHNDSPSGQAQLGVMYQALGQFDKAIAAYRHALILDSYFVTALLNIADVYRQTGQESKGVVALKDAINLDQDFSPAQYALGLVYIRIKQINKALPFLKGAADLSFDNAHYSYVYAVALYESGQAKLAIKALRENLGRHPQHTLSTGALKSYLKQ